jgi:hypothetical protein
MGHYIIQTVDLDTLGKHVDFVNLDIHSFLRLLGQIGFHELSFDIYKVKRS